MGEIGEGEEGRGEDEDEDEVADMERGLEVVEMPGTEHDLVKRP